jgi:hypothetical protein
MCNRFEDGFFFLVSNPAHPAPNNVGSLVGPWLCRSEIHQTDSSVLKPILTLVVCSQVRSGDSPTDECFRIKETCALDLKVDVVKRLLWAFFNQRTHARIFEMGCHCATECEPPDARSGEAFVSRQTRTPNLRQDSTLLRVKSAFRSRAPLSLDRVNAGLRTRTQTDCLSIVCGLLIRAGPCLQNWWSEYSLPIYFGSS